MPNLSVASVSGSYSSFKSYKISLCISTSTCALKIKDCRLKNRDGRLRYSHLKYLIFCLFDE